MLDIAYELKKKSRIFLLQLIDITNGLETFDRAYKEDY